MTRINAAMARIDAARTQIDDAHAPQLAKSADANATNTTTNVGAQGEAADDGATSARVIALVDAHEKLREEVAETIGQIDSLIEELEE